MFGRINAEITPRDRQNPVVKEGQWKDCHERNSSIILNRISDRGENFRQGLWPIHLNYELIMKAETSSEWKKKTHLIDVKHGASSEKS